MLDYWYSHARTASITRPAIAGLQRQERMTPNLSCRYRAALWSHLQAGPREGLPSPSWPGGRLRAAVLRAPALATLHEQTLVSHILPGLERGRRAAIIRRAALFFAAAAAPLLEGDGGAVRGIDPKRGLIAALSQRTVTLAVANQELSLEVVRRRAAEAALVASEIRSRHRLRHADRQQQQSRILSHMILSAQEEERKTLSRDLHDVIAQTLTGVHLRLTTLKREAEPGTKDLKRSIDRTQRLVEQAFHIVSSFARTMRPALLDDLGLIPALRAHLGSLGKLHGLRTHLTVVAGVEQLDLDRRTALFRVAQEALTNVCRHAKATRVIVSIRKHASGYRMSIHDDGRSFDVRRVMAACGHKRLGLLGMHERLAMVGGRFTIESAPGKGTTVMAHVPLGLAAAHAIGPAATLVPPA